MAYNRQQKMRDNIEAIRCALTLGAEHRAPTADERDILAKYAGFGGLKCILNDANELSDAARWSKSDLPLFAPTVELRRLIHDFAGNDYEFKAMMDSLKASVLTAFYTPEPIVEAIARSLDATGLRAERFLDPSAGAGVFVRAFAGHNPGAEIMAFEKDTLTGRILAGLYGDKTVRVEGFEKIEQPFSNYFDIAASNIPFGDFAVPDPLYSTSKEAAYRNASRTIHNYFFLKGLDSVREGGIVAFIASQGVMNAASPHVRIELMKRADLIAAVRLPNNTFADSANTEVGSDLIILQKHTGKKALRPTEEQFIVSVKDEATQIVNNRYFVENPGQIISTQSKIGTDPYPILTARPEDAMSKVREVINNGHEYDIVFFDLPGTINNPGVVKTVACMDYIFCPVAADKLILESSLAFALKVHNEIITTGKSSIRQFQMLWNLVDARERTELYDLYERVFEEYGLATMKTRIPDTKRYRREGSKEINRPVFRSTMLPPDKTLLKGSRVEELAAEILSIIGLTEK